MLSYALRGWILLSSLCHKQLYLAFIDSYHGLAKVFAQFGYDLRIVIVGNGFHYSLRTLYRITALEDAATYEDAFCSQLHHKCRIGWKCGSNLQPVLSPRTWKIVTEELGP